MPINYTSSELQLSGTVTNAEWYSVTSTAGLTKRSDSIFELTANMRIMSGADVSGLNNFIVELNTFDIFLEDDNVVLDQLTFIEGGPRSVADRQIFRTAGSGDYPNLKNFQYIHNISGNPGGADPRYLSMMTINSASNTTFRASEFSEQEIDGIQIGKSGEMSNITGVRVKRFIASNDASGNPINVKINNLTQSSKIYINGGILAAYNGASMMIANWSRTGLGGTNTNWLDNYNGQLGTHYVYLLGTASDHYMANGVGITQKKTTLNVVTGGDKYYQFVDGEDAKFAYFDSRGSSPQNCVPVTTNSEMLDANTEFILDSTEKIEFITRSMRYYYNGSAWVEQNISGQFFRCRKYGKIFIEQSFSDVDAVEGSADSYAPINLLSDNAIAESDKSIVDAYTGILITPTTITLSSGEWTAHKLRDAIKAYLVDHIEEADYGNFDGVTFDIGDKNLIIDAVDFVKSGDIDLIQTTGLITLQNNATINFNFLDSVGNAIVTFDLPVGWNFAGLYGSSADAISDTNPLSSNNIYKYNTTSSGGNRVWAKITESGGLGVAYDDYVLESSRGIYETSVVVSTEDSLLTQIRSLVRSNNTLVTSINQTSNNIYDRQLTQAHFDDFQKRTGALLAKVSDVIQPNNSNLNNGLWRQPVGKNAGTLVTRHKGLVVSKAKFYVGQIQNSDGTKQAGVVRFKIWKKVSTGFGDVVWDSGVNIDLTATTNQKTISYPSINKTINVNYYEFDLNPDGLIIYDDLIFGWEMISGEAVMVRDNSGNGTNYGSIYWEQYDIVNGEYLTPSYISYRDTNGGGLELTTYDFNAISRFQLQADLNDIHEIVQDIQTQQLTEVEYDDKTNKPRFL